MVSIGLVPDLTARAAALAALGAGARPVGGFSYRLTAGDVAAIRAERPDVVLLAGGTDGGDTESIVHNARALADAGLSCPVVVAGNREAAPAAAGYLVAGGCEVILAANVLPELDRLNVEPARDAIRRLFVERIVRAKGIDRVADVVDVLMPTPTAVLEAARLLAGGAGDLAGMGDLVVVDVGGATTDVHSVCEGAPGSSGVVRRGIPEPRVKRTVEGDLGLRQNAASVLEAAGPGALAAAAGAAPEAVVAWVERVAADGGCVPVDRIEARLDVALAAAATRAAVARHAGRQEIVYTPSGKTVVQEGKDLSAVRVLVGTGGVFASNPNGGGVLRAALRDPSDPASLRPVAPAPYIDRDYLLYAAGLLAAREPAAAFALARSSLVPAVYPEEVVA
jgi:uncharacterized protein (TIGR01319 family)